MGLVLFIIVLIVASLTIYLLIKGKSEEKSDERICIYPKFKFKDEEEMQEQFREAYLWACDMFGVYINVYEKLDEDLKTHSSLDIPYFTYYKVSTNHTLFYPHRLQKTCYKIKEWRNPSQQYSFVLEFLSIVNKIRYKFDEDELKLFNKYKIDVKNLLTNEFEVDNMSLYSLPQ